MLKKLRLFPVLLLVAGLLVACGDNTATPVPAPATTTAPTAAQKAALGDNSVAEIVDITKSGDFSKPLDSTPDFTGDNVYFTATGSKGMGVFKVAAAGGAATEVFTGAPFVSPRGLSFRPDGQQLFVADTSAINAGKTGQIFVLPMGGGTPTPLAGSAGTAPQNLDVVSQNGQNFIYFSGKDPVSGQPALLKLPATGAESATVVLKGAPLVEPDGVAVTRAGTIYLSDRAAAGNGMGKVFKVSGGSASAIVESIKTGSPAGIALTIDDSLLLVSAFQTNSPNDQVLLVELNTLQTGSVTKVVGQNKAAGGVHLIPSRTKNLWSWADLTAGSGGNGRVHIVR